MFEIGEQSCVGLIKDGKFFLGFGEVVRVPIEATELYFHKANAVFDETAGEKDSFGELVAAVGGVGVFGFLGKVKSFEVFRTHELDRGVEHFVVGADAALALAEAIGEALIELATECDLAIEVSFGDLATTLGILQSHDGIADGKRSRVGLEESCAGVIVSSVDGDVGRQGLIEAGRFQFVCP